MISGIVFLDNYNFPLGDQAVMLNGQCVYTTVQSLWVNVFEVSSVHQGCI